MTDELNKSPPQHTAGPWMVEPINGGQTYQITSAESKHFLVIAETPLDGTGRDEANARVLAAAPKLLEALERALDILEGIADKLLYEEGQPVTFLESREIEDIYNDAISELAPFETLIREARGQQ